MNLRTHKQMRLRQQAYILENAYWQRVIDSAMEKAMAFTPAELAEQKARNEALWNDLWGNLEKNMAQRQLVEADPLEEPSTSLPRYTVVKKSTGEIVAENLYLDDAEAMILKAAKNKKAALVLA